MTAAPPPLGAPRTAYIGMNDKSAEIEARALRAQGGDASVVVIGAHRGGGNVAKGELSDADVKTQIGALPIPAERRAAITGAILDPKTDPSSRDELVGLAKAWAPAEERPPRKIPTRLVLSGHSYGAQVFGDHGTLKFESIERLAKAMPNAAKQQEHQISSACNTGGPGYHADRFQRSFPNQKSYTGYVNTAPSPSFGSARDLTAISRQLDQSGRIDPRELGSKNVMVKQGGSVSYSGPERSGESIRADVEKTEADFTRRRSTRGGSGRDRGLERSARAYYDSLQRQLQHRDARPEGADSQGARTKLNALLKSGLVFPE